MVIIIKGYGKIIKQMDMAYIKEVQVENIKVNGWMINLMGME